MLVSKTCSTCKNDKPTSEFYRDKSKKDGLTAMCIPCRKSYEKKYYQENAEKLREYSRLWYKDNLDRAKSASSKRYHENIEHRRVKRKEVYWRDREENIRKSSEYHLARVKSDPFYRFQVRCRTRVYQAIVGNGYSKRTRAYKLIGCTKEELVKHIESMFSCGMTWENYGEWHVDHEIPISSAESQEEIELLCHYLNMRPLWAFDNISKGATFCPEHKQRKLDLIRRAIEHHSR